MGRIADDVYAIPQFEVTAPEVEGFLDELRPFHARFRDCLRRSEPREHFFRYMVGQFNTLAHTSIEPIAVQTEASSIRAMQRSLSAVPWDDARMRHTYHHLVADDMGEPDGIVMVDESGFPKQGKASVGIARQYCGTFGKVDNCQVGVFAAYASRQGYALVDQRLFLPEVWFPEAYAAHRATCGMPEELTWQSKPQLAAAMVRCLSGEGIVPFRYIVAACLYGNRPEFWAACEACVGTIAFVAILADTYGWLASVATQPHTYRYRGALQTKRAVATAATPARSVAELARVIVPTFWYCRTVAEGSKGLITYEFARWRVTLCKENQPAQTVWLVIKRTCGANPTYWYDISNAPVSTPLSQLV
jgi:SRSO17 transposase